VGRDSITVLVLLEAIHCVNYALLARLQYIRTMMLVDRNATLNLRPEVRQPRRRLDLSRIDWLTGYCLSCGLSL